MKFFEFKHLPEHLQIVSRPFCEIAQEMRSLLTDGAEKTATLRKILQ